MCVSELKNKLNTKINIVAKKQKLVFNKKEMEDDQTLDSLGIKNPSIIKIVLKPTYVFKFGGNIMKRVEKDDVKEQTIGALKNDFSYPGKDDTLLYKKKKLSDEMKLVDFIKENKESSNKSNEFIFILEKNNGGTTLWHIGVVVFLAFSAVIGWFLLTRKKGNNTRRKHK